MAQNQNQTSPEKAKYKSMSTIDRQKKLSKTLLFLFTKNGFQERNIQSIDEHNVAVEKIMSSRHFQGTFSESDFDEFLPKSNHDKKAMTEPNFMLTTVDERKVVTYYPDGIKYEEQASNCGSSAKEIVSKDVELRKESKTDETNADEVEVAENEEGNEDCNSLSPSSPSEVKSGKKKNKNKKKSPASDLTGDQTTAGGTDKNKREIETNSGKKVEAAKTETESPKQNTLDVQSSGSGSKKSKKKKKSGKNLSESQEKEESIEELSACRDVKKDTVSVNEASADVVPTQSADAVPSQSADVVLSQSDEADGRDEDTSVNGVFVEAPSNKKSKKKKNENPSNSNSSKASATPKNESKPSSSPTKNKSASEHNEHKGTVSENPQKKSGSGEKLKDHEKKEEGQSCSRDEPEMKKPKKKKVPTATLR